MISNWLKWLSVSLARNINSETLIITAITNFSDLKIQELSQFSLSSNFHFLHTNLKDSCIFLILMLHWARIIHCLEQFNQNSSRSRAFSWQWKLEIEAYSRGFIHSFLHKASKESHRRWSGAVELERSRVQKASFQGDSNFILSFCWFLDIEL
jgi:hypothetical protein